MMIKLFTLTSMCLFCLHDITGFSIDLPKVLEVLDKDNVVLPCNITGYNGDLSSLKFYWMISNTMIQAEQTLKISIIGPSQSGTYTCYVAVDGMIYNSSVDIRVYYAPMWIDWAVRKFSGTPGSKATILCLVDSFPLSSFRWLSPSNTTIASQNSKYTINNSAQSSSLVINNVDSSDYGTYTCQAENRVSGKSYSLQLLMPGPPDGPQTCTQTSSKSDSVTVTCVEGYTGGSDGLDYSVKVYNVQNQFLQSSVVAKRTNSTSSVVALEVTGLASKQKYTLDVYASNAYGISFEPLSMYVTTASGLVNVGPGAPDNSKVVALAVCVPFFFVVVVGTSLALVYAFYVRNKNDVQQTSEVSNFQQALDNFPTFSRADQSLNSDSKRLILSQKSLDKLESNENLSRINFAFTHDNDAYRIAEQPSLAGFGDSGAGQRPYFDSNRLIFSQTKSTYPESNQNFFQTNSAFTCDDAYGGAAQPSLAGCGALRAVQVKQEPPKICFMPGKTVSGINLLEEEESHLYGRGHPCAVSDAWEFPRNKFYLKSKLGEGSLGEVWVGRMVDGQESEGGRLVAIKNLHDNFTDDEKELMLEDIRVMKSVGFHPNILQLIGCCTTSYPPCMIMEFASRGTLLNLLRQQKFSSSSSIRVTTKDVESFALQIASAMEHVASMRLLHKDLACRNVLMSNNLICKLADFEREHHHFQDSTNLDGRKTSRVHIRWLPPESLFVMEKSIKSNIWSFGILLWECYTLGSDPYPGMNNKEVVDFVQRGGRMPKPSFCSQEMYEFMQSCWVYYPNKRASFAELRRRIQRIYEATTDGLQMDFAAGEWSSKSWNASPQDLGEFV